MGVLCKGNLRKLLVLAAAALPPISTAVAQDKANSQSISSEISPKTKETAPGQPGVVEDKCIFGVLPNYRTAEGAAPFAPITTKQKFTIAAKDTFDWPSYILGGAFAGISQLENSNPSFGQGLKGYAKRYAANTADQDLGNFMTEAIMPTLLHEDPRYFRKGHGSAAGRVGYAVSRVFVTKNDSGSTGFNFSEFLGTGSVAAVGNIYYPDEKGFDPTMQRMFTQIGTDAISDVLKEFWPDVKRKWFNKRDGNVASEN
jgi:hypothetical protein